MDIKSLLGNSESLWLEFKSYWYWSNQQKDTNNELNEFLKDIIALFNTQIATDVERKYFLLGYDEKRKVCNHFYEDRQGSIIDKLPQSEEDFKEFLLSKLKNATKMICKDNTIPFDSDFISQYINIEIIEQNKKKLLLIEIFDAPCLLLLSRNVKSYSANSCLIRTLKKNAPEVATATVEYIENFKKNKALSGNLCQARKKVLSISKMIDSYKAKHLPTAKLEYYYDKKLKYESYSINQMSTSTFIVIIYISRLSNQKQVIENIKSSTLLNENLNKVIVILDNHNKSGGTINIPRIEKLFSSIVFKYSNVDFLFNTIQQFSLLNIYEEMDEQLFHQGKFAINDFVIPHIAGSEDIHKYIFEWLKKEDNPLLVLKGGGGIGKTTVVKYYLDRFYARNPDLKIVFISSHDMIDALSTTGEIKSLYDFYKVFFKEIFDQEDLEDQENLLDQAAFELLIDHGEIIFVIDGIDEVLAKLSDRFQVNNFMSSIFNDYLDTLAKSKIIFTCRDEFWDIDNEYQEKISTLDLLPFNKSQAKDFFNKKFDNNENKINKAITLADSFAQSNNNAYIPYILDMIKEELIIETHEVKADSNLLDASIVNEFLIAQVCDREIKKMGFENIQVQLEFFMKLAVDYDGKVLSSNCTFISEELLKKYQSHPLLFCKTDGNGEKILSFRYDFFTDYFKALYVYSYINDSDNYLFLKELHEDKKNKIFNIANGSYMQTFIYEKFKADENIFNIILELLTYYVNDFSDNKPPLLWDKEISSSIFILLLSMKPNEDKEFKTNLLKLVYSSSDIVRNLVLKNIYPTSKIVFNFSDLVFESVNISNYADFAQCTFSNNTLFKTSTFEEPLWKVDNQKMNFNKDNFDAESLLSCAALNAKLISIAQQNIVKEESISEIIIMCLKLFWKGGSFRDVVADRINNRMRMHNRILKSLLSVGVLKETKITTREKRNQHAYQVNSVHQAELSKIFDQNSSNSVFQQIVKDVQEDIS